ncbi:MAG TPA: hypothetical protein VNY73_01575 [Bacteroidia bacterium]|jgi:hypothetical protein|nr:hypothetical protein [Bacteroidia bacterium]
MKLLTNPKTTYLLEASLEVLHAESLEWLSEISYWRDELAFFYTLLVKKTNHALFDRLKNELLHIQEELILLSGHEFEKLELDIKQHEAYLSDLIKADSGEKEQTYRAKHKAILVRVHAFSKRVRKLKLEVFEIVKMHA